MNSFWKNRPLLITVIVVLVLIVLLIATAGKEDATGAESLIGGILEPIQGFFYDSSEAVASFFRDVFTQNDALKENVLLKEKIADLEGKLKEFEEIKKENERFKALLDYAEQNTNFKYITARVTGRSPGQWFVVFTIDAGVGNGIRKDMAVVNKDGLVGRIIETGANYSQVMALIDSRSGVSGLIERTRDNGIVLGSDVSAGSAMLKMQYLPLDADLMPGDRIITSGIDGVFPKGLEIGEITEVSRGQDDAQKNAVVKPAVDFLHLEEIMVIAQETAGSS